jgi:peptidyl-prolyl cis-trans isomerase SurA
MNKKLLLSLLWIVTTSAFAAPAAQPDTLTEPVMINQIVAIANQDAITQSQLDQALQQANLQIQQSGLTPPTGLPFERQVLQQLILQKIALQLAKVNGININDDAVNQAINGLLTENHATEDQLKQSLQQAGVSYDQYRETIRTQLTISRLEQKAVAGSIMITPQEIDNFLAARAKLPNKDTQYDLSHILIALPNDPTPDIIAQYKAKAQQIANQLTKGQLSFAKAAMQYSAAGDAMKGGDLGYKTSNELPTLFVSYLPSLTVGKVVGPIQDANGFHIFTLNGVKTPPPEKHFVQQYHVLNILVKTSPVVDDARAQALLNQLKESIQNGKPFAELAQTNSQDVDSRANGGDMGWKSLAQFNDSTFANEVLSLPLNAVSTPFKTDAGWQIIQVIGKRQYDDTQDYIRDQAAQTLFQQKAENALQTWQDKIVGESYVKILVPDLDPAAAS